jgi:hypothetical protein
MAHEVRLRFGSAFARLCAAWSREATPEQLEAYFSALSDLPIEAVEAAMAAAPRSCSRFPVVVELRSLAGATDQRTRAIEAWERRAWQTSPIDPIAQRAINALGPMDKVKDWEGPWARDRFLEFYERLSESAEARRRVERLQLTAPQQGRIAASSGGNGA